MTAAAFYSLIIGFVSGVFLRSFFVIPLPILGWLTLLLVGLMLLRYVLRPTATSKLVVCSGLVLTASLFGVLRMEVASWFIYNPIYDERIGTSVIIKGEVVKEPDMRAESQHLYVDDGFEWVLVIAEPLVPVAYGDQVLVRGELRKPEAFTTDLGRTFNYEGYVRAKGAEYMIRSPEQLTVLDTGGNPAIVSLLKFKHWFQTNLRQVLPEPQVGLSEGLLLGEKRAIGEELTTVFRQTGIIHIVVLSGYNVMLVVAFFMYILSYGLSLRGQVVGGLVGIIAFALLVGLSATVVRASIMASLFLIGRGLGRSYTITRALLFAGAVMIALNPYLLVYDPGFQLSFLATLGLVFIAPQFETKIITMPNTIGLRGFLVATLATQVAVLPLLLYQVGELSIVAVVVNMLVLPMVPVAMLLTFMTGIIAAVAPVLALPLAYLANLSLSYILVIATWFGSLPFAALSVPLFSFWWVVVAYIAMGLLIWKLVKQKESVVVENEVDDWLVEIENGSNQLSLPFSLSKTS